MKTCVGFHHKILSFIIWSEITENLGTSSARWTSRRPRALQLNAAARVRVWAAAPALSSLQCYDHKKTKGPKNKEISKCKFLLNKTQLNYILDYSCLHADSHPKAQSGSRKILVPLLRSSAPSQIIFSIKTRNNFLKQSGVFCYDPPRYFWHDNLALQIHESQIYLK